MYQSEEIDRSGQISKCGDRNAALPSPRAGIAADDSQPRMVLARGARRSQGRWRALIVSFLALSGPPAFGAPELAGVDMTISGESLYPVAVNPQQVGTYPAAAKSGAGYFYDDVLEYRVWFHPKWGADLKNGNGVYFYSFAQYEKALELSIHARGAEQPLALVRQMQYINEPSPGVFEVVDAERIAEWKVQWLTGAKRSPEAIEKFMSEHKK